MGLNLRRIKCVTTLVWVMNQALGGRCYLQVSALGKGMACAGSQGDAVLLAFLGCWRCSHPVTSSQLQPLQLLREDAGLQLAGMYNCRPGTEGLSPAKFCPFFFTELSWHSWQGGPIHTLEASLER